MPWEEGSAATILLLSEDNETQMRLNNLPTITVPVGAGTRRPKV